MRSPSGSMPGNQRGPAPVATTMCFAVWVSVLPSAWVTSTLPSPSRRAVPSARFTPYFLNSPVTPRLNCLLTLRLRWMTLA